MARDALAITALNIDALTAEPTALTLDAANDVTIAAGGNAGKLVIRVSHTAAAEYDLTLVAPTDSPQAIRSSLGSVVVPFAAGNVTPVVKFFVIESARFAQSDGAIHIDLETGFTGSAWAYRLPDEA